MESLIEKTSLYKSHLETSTGVEIWGDNYVEDGWKYYSIVSRNNGIVRKLEYVRINNRIIQHRKYDSNGDDLWLKVK